MSAALALLLLTGLGFNATPPVHSPWTISNDDSCDIGVAPAATLLLPYFEIDLDSPADAARTTLFTITNVGAAPQIARVTIWSDWAFPVLTFNIFLTGYDVQSINLRDVIVGGAIVPTSIGTAPGNPNFLAGASTHCGAKAMPRNVPASMLEDVRSALTTGKTSLCGTRVGGFHTWAIGYATVDVVADCTFMLPSDEGFQQRELLFDNVLIGDYQIVDPHQNSANGESMVHVRTCRSPFTTASRRRPRAVSIAASRCRPLSRRATSRAERMASAQTSWFGARQ
jgi:hypothetical protein